MGRIFIPQAERTVFFGGNSTNISASTTVYAGLGVVNASIANVAGLTMTGAGSFKSLYARSAGGNIGTTTETWTVTLFKNGVATAITFVMTGAVATGNDTAHSVDFVAGDYFYVQIIASAGTSARPAVFAGGIA